MRSSRYILCATPEEPLEAHFRAGHFDGSSEVRGCYLFEFGVFGPLKTFLPFPAPLHL